MSKNQKITIIVDMYTTDALEFDAPFLVQALYQGSSLSDQAKDTKRYRIQFELPKTLSKVAGEITDIQIIEDP